MIGFEKLIKLLEKEYYSSLFMAFFEMIAIITGLLFIRKDKMGVFFLAYLFFDFVALLADNYVQLSTTTKESSFFVIITNVLISLIELLVYYHFFFKIIQNKAIIKLMKVLRIIFVGIIIIFITTEFAFLTKRYFYLSQIIGTTEFLFLLLPCLVYFYEILKNDPIINLYQRPSFWIVTGIFIYALISVPFYLITHFVSSNHYQYRYFLNFILYYVPFTINFIFLTKAFLCKKALTI